MEKNKLCPLCNKRNNCCNGLPKNLGVCWCTHEIFPEKVFELIPEEQLRVSCICKDCLHSLKKT